MLLLMSTTDKIQLVTSAALPVDVHASYMDHPLVAGVMDISTGGSPGRKNTAISTAATTDIVAAPGSNFARNVKTLHVRNKDASGQVNVKVIYEGSATDADVELFEATLNAGEELEYIEGVGFFVSAQAVPSIVQQSAVAATGQNVGTAQPWIPTSGGVTLAAGTRYRFDGAFNAVRSAGTTSHTTGIGFGGTATITNIAWWAQCREGEADTFADSDMIFSNSAANKQVKTTSTTATEVVSVTVTGFVTINAAGTFIPQFTYSSAPGGAPTLNAYFKMETLQTIGAWS